MTASQPCIDTQKTTSFKNVTDRHFNWNSRLQPNQSLVRPYGYATTPSFRSISQMAQLLSILIISDNLRFSYSGINCFLVFYVKTTEWLTSPADTSASLLEDILRPSCSPPFSMDLEPSGASASDHLFAPSSTSRWGEKASASQYRKNSFNRPNNKESVIFDSFENIFMNHAREFIGKSCGPQCNDNNIQPFYLYQTQLSSRHSAEPMYFPQEQNPFKTNRYSFAPSFSTRIHHPNQSNHFQPFSQLSHPSTCPPLGTHHSDMMHYPPSHMLERGPAPPFSSLLSPEHWSFPPMKLY